MEKVKLKLKFDNIQRKASFANVSYVYIIIFFVVAMLYCAAYKPSPIGEFDDYSLQVATLLNDHNFGISTEDVVFYKTLFPDWAEYIDGYCISDFSTKAGTGKLTYYFPTYGIACVPLTIIFRLLHLPTVYTFHCTNIVVMIIAVWFLRRFLEASEGKKFSLIIMLTINPIVFYLSWPSAEVLIFALVVMGMVCWSNGWYKGAAIFISLAGTLNPTVLFVGIVMIVDFCISVLRKKDDGTTWISHLAKSFPSIVRYGFCYIIALIPMAYFYYNIGHISIVGTAYDSTNSLKETIARFLAYLFDLNFGIFPYFTVLLTVGILLGILAIKKREIRFIKFFAAFLGTMMAYSLMWHINCGISGISRYNAWNTVIIIFAIVLYYDVIISTESVKRICRGALYTGIILTGTIVFVYNPYRALATNYTYMTPVAKVVLQYMPELYNPLFSTFNNRVNHLDGGYNYWDYTPIIYADEEGYIRKILADSTNKEELRKTLYSATGDELWLEGKINSLDGTARYINVSRGHKVIKASEYELGTMLHFDYNKNNVDSYVIKGIGGREEWGTWTEGHTALMRFRTESDCKEITGVIDGIAFNGVQRVEIYVNDEIVFNDGSFSGGTIEFNFKNPGSRKPIEMRIELPDAISPMAFGSSDARVLGLGIQEMSFVEME